MSITKEKLAKLREVAASVSGAPWTSDVWHETDGQGWRATGPHHEDTDEPSEPGCPAEQRAQLDAAFIAAADPTTVTALVDEIEHLRKLLGDVTDAWASGDSYESHGVLREHIEREGGIES